MFVLALKFIDYFVQIRFQGLCDVQKLNDI